MKEKSLSKSAKKAYQESLAVLEDLKKETQEMVVAKTTPTKSKEEKKKTPAVASGGSAQKKSTANDDVESTKEAGTSCGDSQKKSPTPRVPRKPTNEPAKIADDFSKEAAAEEDQSAENSEAADSAKTRKRKSTRGTSDETKESNNGDVDAITDTNTSQSGKRKKARRPGRNRR